MRQYDGSENSAYLYKILNIRINMTKVGVHTSKHSTGNILILNSDVSRLQNRYYRKAKSIINTRNKKKLALLFTSVIDNKTTQTLYLNHFQQRALKCYRCKLKAMQTSSLICRINYKLLYVVLWS